MKGYIYTMYQGADPGKGWVMNDPIFGTKPTLGACMPNIRRLVNKGDFIFTISGRVKDVQQFVVGGFAVEAKLNAMAASELFPQNILRKNEDGTIEGNIIVDANGNRVKDDNHSNWENRIETILLGKTQYIFRRNERSNKQEKRQSKCSKKL